MRQFSSKSNKPAIFHCINRYVYQHYSLIGDNTTSPRNLTITFNSSGVILQWSDPGNNCPATEYQVILNSSASDNTYYNTTSTSWFINKTDLSLTENYTYIVKGWNGKESDISAVFTLGKSLLKCLIVYILIITATAEVNCTLDDGTNDVAYPCDNTCCVNITLNITPVRQCIRI